MINRNVPQFFITTIPVHILATKVAINSDLKDNILCVVPTSRRLNLSRKAI